MSNPSGVAAAFAYLPVVGWLYVFLFQHGNKLALFHLRQSVGLILFLVGVLVGWAVVAWILAWIPYVAVISIALFAIVVAAYLYGVVALVLGVMNALRNRFALLPFFGGFANRLPIR